MYLVCHIWDDGLLTFELRGPLLSRLVAVHIIAHLFNFEYFMDAQLNRNSSLLPFILSEIGTGDNASFLNPIRTNETVSSYLYCVQLVCLSVLQNSLKFPLPDC